MANRTLWDRLFVLWVTVGLFEVALAMICVYRCPSLHHSERTFRYVGTDPETQARYDQYDRWEARLAVLANGSLVHGLLGVLVFFKRGCVVFVIALCAVAVCGFVWLDATWVPL